MADFAHPVRGFLVELGVHFGLEWGALIADRSVAPLAHVLSCHEGVLLPTYFAIAFHVSL